jgi:hypothetical protein
MDEPDYTYVGDIEYRRSRYEIIQSALVMLRDAVRAWNELAAQQGVGHPYEDEEDWLTSMVDWGVQKLANPDARSITVNGISVHSLRLQRAALDYAAAKTEEDVRQKSVGMPPSIAERMRTRVDTFVQEAAKISKPPHGILDEVLQGDAKHLSARTTTKPHEWDVFVSHASEDKEAIARPLVLALQNGGLKVWFDESAMAVGDSLRESIDRGLARSRFGVVVLSPHFFAKHWTRQELDGLAAKEVGGVKVILPVWHDVDHATVLRHSPLLANRIGALSHRGVNVVAAELLRAMQKAGHGRSD